MRIAWVVPGFQGRDDEPGIPALTAMAHALTQGHEVQVFAVRFPPRSERYHLGGVQVQGFGGMEGGRSPLSRRAVSLWRWVRVLRALAQAHSQHKFDIIHGWWATESGMLAALAGHILGVPTVVSLAGGELAGVRAIGYGSRIRPLEWGQVLLALRLATAIGVPSDDTRRRVLVHAPWLHRRLLPLPLGYDPATFAAPSADEHAHLNAVRAPDMPAAWPPSLAPPDSGIVQEQAALCDLREAPTDHSRRGSCHPAHPRWRFGGPSNQTKPAETAIGAEASTVSAGSQPADSGHPTGSEGPGKILCVASWTPVKGHELLLDAAALLLARNIPFHLTLVGERTDQLEARAAVAARGLQEHVSHRGALSQREVSALLAEAHLLALASWHEAECLAVVEALTSGVPVVAPPVGIARELLTDPRLGACIPHRSSAHLADALQAQLQRPWQDEPLARRLRRQSVADLALPRVADQFLAAYGALRGRPGITT